MIAVRLFMSRLRSELVPALLLAFVVLVTAFLAAAAPRLFNRAADAGLRHEVAEAQPAERNIQLAQVVPAEVVPEAVAGMSAVEQRGEALEAALPDSVRRILAGGSEFAESIVWTVQDSPPARPGFVELRFQSRGLDDQIRLTAGRMPTGSTRQVTPPASQFSVGDLDATLFEVALSSITAAELEVEVGDRLDLLPDFEDPLVGSFGFPQPAAIRVVGVFEVIDPEANFWVGDRSLHQPTLVPVGTDVVLVNATALASPDAYPALVGLGFPVRNTWRHYVDPGLLDAANVDRLVVDLRGMEARYASFLSTPGEATMLQTGLLEVTERFLVERWSAEAVLMTAAIGPVAIALAAIGVLALLAVARRRGSLILLRGRGASAAQVVGSHLVEALLFSVPPAVLGALLASRVMDARPSPLSLPAAVLVALGAMVAVVIATLPIAVSPLRRLERGDPAPMAGSPRRLALEAVAVLLALAGVLLLRQRGLSGGSAAGRLDGVDPFLAAVPALVGLAAGIVTVRLYPLPVRVAGWLAEGGRGLVPALGLRRAQRQAGTGHLPLVVLLLTVAIGAFSATMLATIDRGQESATWQAVGAAHRVSIRTPLPEDLDLGGVDGVSAVAGRYNDEASIGIGGGTRIDLVAIDAAAYEAVTAGTPAETTFPAAFTDAPGGGEERPGTTERPIPAIVSRSLIGESSTPLRVGATFQITIGSRLVTLVVTEIRGAIPIGDPAGRWVIVPRDQLRASLPGRSVVATTLFVRAPENAAPAIEAALEASPIDWRLESRAGLHAELQRRPLVQAVETGFAVSLALALAYAAVAITISLVLSGRARARETAHLRTMGLNRMQVTLLSVLEHVPPVLVAAAAGLGLGVAVGWIVLPGLGLGAFTGSGADPTLVIDPRPLLGVTAALAAVVAVGIGMAAWTQGRSDPAVAVREAVI